MNDLPIATIDAKNPAMYGILNEPMGRRSFGAVAIAMTALALSACGSDDGSGGASGGVQVKHKFGTTTVPSKPKRVVSAGVTEQDTLLAVGVIPVGITDWYGDQPYGVWPWAQDELGDATPELLNQDDGLQFEKIAALEPDLIVATNAGLSEEDYQKLSDIAPTIPQSGEYTDYFEPWTAQAASIGKGLWLEDEMTDVIDGVTKQFADAAAANPQFAGKKVIFLQNAVYDGSLIAYQKGLGTDFLTDLGFDIPSDLDPFVPADDSSQAYIPVEQISVLNSADVLVWGTEKDEDRVALESTPGFLELAAVKAGRSIYTGGELAGAIYFSSPLSLPYVVENLVPQLAAVLRAS